MWAKDRPVSAGGEDGVTGRGHSGAPFRGAQSSGGPSAFPPAPVGAEALRPVSAARHALGQLQAPQAEVLRDVVSVSSAPSPSVLHPVRDHFRQPLGRIHAPSHATALAGLQAPGLTWACALALRAWFPAQSRGWRGCRGHGAWQSALDVTPGAVGCYTVWGAGTD